MNMAEARSLIDQEYLKENYLEVYLEDAVAQLLSNRQEGNKSPVMKPCRFFKEYFSSVHQGTHVLFREFAFLNATPYNRLCLLKAILQIYRPLFYREERYNARDYHSILQLVWPDFRMQVVQDAFTAYDDDKKDEENCIKFIDFVKAMRASFCTGDFNYEASIIDKQIDARIDEFSKITSQGCEAFTNLTEADFLVNVEGDASASTSVNPTPWSKILDGSEFKRILNINDSNSISSDEPEPDPMSASSESRKTSKGKGKGKKGNTSKAKSRGRLGGKNLSNSLNLLKTGKTDADGKKPKRRPRSKSATAVQRNQLKKVWRP